MSIDLRPSQVITLAALGWSRVYRCETCKRTGKVSCSACGGSGGRECNTGCKHECLNCNGTGEVKCPECDGAHNACQKRRAA